MPQFQFENIVCISHNRILKRSSNTYADLLSELLDDKENRTKQFFSSLYQWRFYDFIAKCFSDPTVINIVNSNDEQVQLFLKSIEERNRISVLDFGGGSGRLGLSLKMIEENNPQNRTIDYSIYDREPGYHGDLFPVYQDINSINDRFDVVVMMNFLHEVEPTDWPDIFRRIYVLMNDDGFLLFVEVITLSEGEKPNDTGYLVLGLEELSVLFSSSHNLTEIKIKENQKSNCVLIKKSDLKKVTEGSVRKAIKCLEDRTFREISLFRENKSESHSYTVSDAQRYAFLTQQYINARLFNINDNNTANPRNKYLLSNEKKSLLKKLLDFIPIYKDSSKDSIVNNCNEIESLIRAAYNGETISDNQLFSCYKNIEAIKSYPVDNNLLALYIEAFAIIGYQPAIEELKSYEMYLLDEVKSLIAQQNL